LNEVIDVLGNGST